jgi:hypothetical protein
LLPGLFALRLGLALLQLLFAQLFRFARSLLLFFTHLFGFAQLLGSFPHLLCQLVCRLRVGFRTKKADQNDEHHSENHTVLVSMPHCMFCERFHVSLLFRNWNLGCAQAPRPYWSGEEKLVAPLPNALARRNAASASGRLGLNPCIVLNHTCDVLHHLLVLLQNACGLVCVVVGIRILSVIVVIGGWLGVVALLHHSVRRRGDDHRPVPGVVSGDRI